MIVAMVTRRFGVPLSNLWQHDIVVHAVESG